MGKDGNIGLDASSRPVQVPPSFAHYLEDEKIFTLFEGMVKSLLIDKPEDPLEWMIKYLQTPTVPKIIISGNPLIDKREAAQVIAQKTNSVLLVASEVIEEFSRQDNEFGKKVADMLSTETPIPSAIKVQLIIERLQHDDVVKNGFVLCDFPTSRPEALALQMSGILPSIFMLCEGKDVVTANESQEAEMQAYNRCLPGLIQSYQAILRRINSSDILEDTWKAVCSEPYSNAPTIPRLLIMGPPGAGCKNVATWLSQKYGIVHVSLETLISQAECGGRTAAAKAYRAAASQGDVPDKIQYALVKEIIQTMESQTKGWVLEGFPNNLAQAKLLKADGFLPKRIFWINTSETVALKRLSSRRMDPVTGNISHQSDKTDSLLVLNPKDAPDHVLHRVSLYKMHEADLKKFYESDITEIDGDEEEHNVLQAIDGRLVRPIQNHSNTSF